MSLIKCPECGQMISSTTKQCVHCGCKISFCNECGNVLVGDVKQCPNCGAPIGAEEAKTAPVTTTITPIATSNSTDSDSAEPENSSIKAIWKKGDIVGAKRDKTMKRTIEVLGSITGSLFSAIMIILLIWVTQNELDRLLNLSKFYDPLKTMLIIMIVIAVCTAVLANIRSLHMYYRSTRYLSRENIDVCAYFEKYRKDDAEEPYADLIDSVDDEDMVLAYFTKNINYMPRIYIIKIIDICITLAVCVLLSVMVMRLFDSLVVLVATMQPMEVDIGSCVVAGVMVAVAIVYYFVSRSPLFYKSMKWLAKEYNIDLSDK
ncbi:MAG TPA: hypothetical protein IAB90_06990 [Candidatus Coproplasma stercoripullorum]|uniref:Zinc ribbon domain-containing protein n=1 Tax=Candidatus Coproplasma stercoripullorum TaxID=2840751 RepID=A0A9D1AH49_9FIRM|nr:hypothetical protein [Candidatus Coproplasma stercoripullorum]